MWQLTTTLREHRGDGHVAAYVTAGLTGLEAQHLQVALGRFPDSVMRSVRGWSAESWAVAQDRLRDRGLLAADGLTDQGRALLEEIEVRTDELAWRGGLAALGDSGVDAVLDVLEPSVTALWSSGMLPDVNPTGLPPVRN